MYVFDKNTNIPTHFGINYFQLEQQQQQKEAFWDMSLL